jgi:hypothetical protein
MYNKDCLISSLALLSILPGDPFFFGNIFFSASTKKMSTFPSRNLHASMAIDSLNTIIPKTTNLSVILGGVK